MSNSPIKFLHLAVGGAVLVAVAFALTHRLVRNISRAKTTTVIVVNSASDDVRNDGRCTLREAIVAANTDTSSGRSRGECVAGAGRDLINFAITGPADFTNDDRSGYTIRPRSQLPDITCLVTIDGYSQPGARPNTATAPLPLNGTLLVELNGTRAGTADGLRFTRRSDGSLVKGLVVNGFSHRNAILALALDGLKVQGNYIGTDPTGSTERPNTVGVNTFSPEAHDVRVGGRRAWQRNLISRNTSGPTATASYPGSGWTFNGKLHRRCSRRAVATPKLDRRREWLHLDRPPKRSHDRWVTAGGHESHR